MNDINVQMTPHEIFERHYNIFLKNIIWQVKQKNFITIPTY